MVIMNIVHGVLKSSWIQAIISGGLPNHECKYATKTHGQQREQTILSELKVSRCIYNICVRIE